jgi:DNA-binding response OmpR family regulator
VQHQILLIEESPESQSAVERSLVGSPCSIVIAENLNSALSKLEKGSFDLIILDVDLPDGDGIEFCGNLQTSEKHRHVPVLFVSRKAEVTFKCKAFSSGADDYIVDPFEPLELKARVEAKLHRLGQRRVDDTTFKRGSLTLNVPFQKAFVFDEGRQKDTGLTPIEFKILYLLAKSEGRIFTRSELLGEIWGSEPQVLEHNLYTHVYALRRKLMSMGNCIQSVPRVGYRFVVSVDQINQKLN